MRTSFREGRRPLPQSFWALGASELVFGSKREGGELGREETGKALVTARVLCDTEQVTCLSGPRCHLHTDGEFGMGRVTRPVGLWKIGEGISAAVPNVVVGGVAWMWSGSRNTDREVGAAGEGSHCGTPGEHSVSRRVREGDWFPAPSWLPSHLPPGWA